MIITLTPQVGQTVLVLVDPAANNGVDIAPAIVTDVWPDGTLNLRVLLDGTATPWLTSVALHPNRAAAEAEHRRPGRPAAAFRLPLP